MRGCPLPPTCLDLPRLDWSLRCGVARCRPPPWTCLDLPGLFEFRGVVPQSSGMFMKAWRQQTTTTTTAVTAPNIAGQELTPGLSGVAAKPQNLQRSSFSDSDFNMTYFGKRSWRQLHLVQLRVQNRVPHQLPSRNRFASK